MASLFSSGRILFATLDDEHTGQAGILGKFYIRDQLLDEILGRRDNHLRKHVDGRSWHVGLTDQEGEVPA